MVSVAVVVHGESALVHVARIDSEVELYGSGLEDVPPISVDVH